MITRMKLWWKILQSGDKNGVSHLIPRYDYASRLAAPQLSTSASAMRHSSTVPTNSNAERVIRCIVSIFCRLAKCQMARGDIPPVETFIFIERKKQRQCNLLPRFLPAENVGVTRKARNDHIYEIL